MTLGQVINAYRDKEHEPCPPITYDLITAGYQQTSGGYIADAKKLRMEVNYKKALPSQGWHLLNYCREHDPSKVFPKSIVCGELYFWMAEICGCVPAEQLRCLADEIIASNIGTTDKPVYDRKKWNDRIQELCFDAINSFVENKEAGK